MYVPYSRKLEEETFTNFADVYLSAIVLSMKSWGMANLVGGVVHNVTSVFSIKPYFSTIHKSFLPRKIPAIHAIVHTTFIHCVEVHVHDGSKLYLHGIK